MHKEKTIFSTTMVLDNGVIIGYLTRDDEMKGLELFYYNLGYEIVAL